MREEIIYEQKKGAQKPMKVSDYKTRNRASPGQSLLTWLERSNDHAGQTLRAERDICTQVCRVRLYCLPLWRDRNSKISGSEGLLPSPLIQTKTNISYLYIQQWCFLTFLLQDNLKNDEDCFKPNLSLKNIFKDQSKKLAIQIYQQGPIHQLAQSWITAICGSPSIYQDLADIYPYYKNLLSKSCSSKEEDQRQIVLSLKFGSLMSFEIKINIQLIYILMLIGLRAIRACSMLARPLLTPSPIMSFSEFFDQQDRKELSDAFMNKYRKKYLHYKLTDQWKKPLQRKEKRRARKAELQLAKIPAQDDAQKLVLHNPAVGIKFPPNRDEVFAVVQVDGFQYKILEDAILILDTKPDHQINKTLTFEKVPLIGTTSYSLLGRPYIRNAKVEAIIESISESEKVIVFKKKRRKNYKRSFGNRQTLTQCRITRIVHDLTQDVLDRAIALQ